MYQSPRSRQNAFAARQSEVLDTVATYRFLAPAIFAARERLATGPVDHALAADGGPWAAVRPRPVRCRLGARFVRLGMWLSGTGVPVDAATPGAHHGATVGG